MKLKNYMKESQKLPLFGIGPYLIYGIGLFTVICIILFVYVFKIGNLSGNWVWAFRIAGGVLIVVPGIPLQREFRVLKEDIPFYRIILECRELHSRTLQELQRERQMKEALEEVMGQYDE